MTNKQNKILGGILIGTTVLNIMMCLNLYRTYSDLVYEVSNLNSSTNAALQSLSRDVWELKTTGKPYLHNTNGQFE